MPHCVYLFFCAAFIFCTNGKFYIFSKISDVVFYVTCRTVTDRHVRINCTLRYVAVSYVMLRYVRVENRH